MPLTLFKSDVTSISRALLVPTWRDFWIKVHAKEIENETLRFTRPILTRVSNWCGEEYGINLFPAPEIGVELPARFLEGDGETLVWGYGPAQAERILTKCRQRKVELGTLNVHCETDEEFDACLDFTKRMVALMKDCRDSGKAALVVSTAEAIT